MFTIRRSVCFSNGKNREVYLKKRKELTNTPNANMVVRGGEGRRIRHWPSFNLFLNCVVQRFRVTVSFPVRVFLRQKRTTDDDDDDVRARIRGNARVPEILAKWTAAINLVDAIETTLLPRDNLCILHYIV